MIDLSGKVCVITGATSGIGLVAAEELATMGARLVLVGRNPARGEAALRRIRRRFPAAKAEMHYADLSRVDEVRRLGKALVAALPQIHILVNNAGGIFTRRAVTPEGLEHTFALNHMAYFVLTELLRERLAASAPSRIVNVSSEAHRAAVLDFADLQTERKYTGWTAYRRSKLCNILFTRELARRLQGSRVTANSLHPGFVATSFGNNNGALYRIALTIGKQMMAISEEKGAETTVHLASSPAVAGLSGLYFDKCVPRTPASTALDDSAARLLWQESARIAGMAA